MEIYCWDDLINFDNTKFLPVYIHRTKLGVLYQSEVLLKIRTILIFFLTRSHLLINTFKKFRVGIGEF